MEIIICILALLTLIFLSLAVISNNKLIELHKQENADLRFENEEIRLQLGNAERRAVEYARKLKKIEDIIIKKEQNNESDTIALVEIKKELFPDCNQIK